MDDPLSAALAPQSIAILGASDNPEKIGGRPIKYMLRAGYKGRLYPINPNRTEIQGLKAYADIASLPEAPDLAIVAVAGKGALDGVKACAARGVKVLLSNSTAPAVTRLYEGNAAVGAAGLRTWRFPARRAVNSKADRRGPVEELVVSNIRPTPSLPSTWQSRASASNTAPRGPGRRSRLAPSR